MSLQTTYPGVYIQELPSSVHTITGVSTSVTAFIGRALKGPVNQATLIHSFADYQRIFGGLWNLSNMSYTVYHYFLNGGSDAIIVRVAHSATPGQFQYTNLTDVVKFTDTQQTPLLFEAQYPGAWSGNDTNSKQGLTISIDHNINPDLDANSVFNIIVTDTATGYQEKILNISTKSTSPRFITTVLKNESQLIQVHDPGIASGNIMTDLASLPSTNAISYMSATATDGSAILHDDVIGSQTVPKTGLYALDEADIFNLLCIPPYLDPSTASNDIEYDQVYPSALQYCSDKRAIFLVDPPSDWTNKDKPKNLQVNQNYGASNNFTLTRHQNAALYFPRFHAPDVTGITREFVSCGVIAGVIAQTDAQRGIWKAPAGIEATLNGVSDLSVKLTDSENGELNPLGINCLRILPQVGSVVWGSRTLRGADMLADQWKYLSVRRTALYIEESLYRGTQWVVFEPNDEPLWSQIRLNVGAFMQDLFRKGAFQGSSPKEAYLVKCDHETTTQDDIDRGIVNIVVGFAPLKPAEFVIIQIKQLTGQQAGG